MATSDGLKDVFWFSEVCLPHQAGFRRKLAKKSEIGAEMPSGSEDLAELIMAICEKKGGTA